MSDIDAGGVIGTLSKKDFTSDQEVRWCPGCGDYAILSAVQGLMPERACGGADRNIQHRLLGGREVPGRAPWQIP